MILSVCASIHYRLSLDLFRIESLAKEFKKRYLTLLKKAHRKLIFPGRTAEFESQKNFYRIIDDLFKVKWVAYAKRPFTGLEQVLEYLGRYTSIKSIIHVDLKPIMIIFAGVWDWEMFEYTWSRLIYFQCIIYHQSLSHPRFAANGTFYPCWKIEF